MRMGMRMVMDDIVEDRVSGGFTMKQWAHIVHDSTFHMFTHSFFHIPLPILPITTHSRGGGCS